MKLQYKIIIMFSIMISTVIGITGYYTYVQIQKTIEMQMGNNAMDLANTIASLPSVKMNLKNKDIEAVQKEIENFREKTRFQYIIVMDMKGIKYSYPYEAGLGKKYLSGGEDRVLKYGEAYTSADRNRFISAIRAFVPIYYEGEQIGALLVGLLNDTVNKEISVYVRNFQVALTAAIILGIVFSVLLANNIKRATFGLEPKEMALLLAEKDLVLESLNAGIIAINKEKEIILMNDEAKKVFGLNNDVIGKNIMDFDYKYVDLLVNTVDNEETIYNIEYTTSTRTNLICSFKPLYNHNEEVIGAVSTFQDTTEVKQLAEELMGIKRLTDDLRAQNHEFLNKLHVISGLIQLGENEQAIKYIADLTQERQELIGILSHNIKDVYVSGLLLAKHSKATEAKIEFEIDSKSHMVKIPDSISRDRFCSLIGNLIENAIEELRGKRNGKIYIKILEKENCVEVIIKDNGKGITKEMQDRIYNRGTSSKKGQRGYGLWIVREIVFDANGKINLDSDDKGTRWQIILPRRRRNDKGANC